MNAMTFSKREEVKAWEQEFVPCEHTLSLNQIDSRHIESKGISQLPRLPSTILTKLSRPQPLFHVRSQGESLDLLRLW
jgi:hypothetical protein